MSVHTPLARLLSQLEEKGRSPREIKKALAAARKSRPVDGAIKLQQMGANYQLAFQVLSDVSTASDRALATKAPGPSASSRFVVGVAFLAAGIAVMKVDVLDTTQYGFSGFFVSRTLFFIGSISLVLGAWRWLRD